MKEINLFKTLQKTLAIATSSALALGTVAISTVSPVSAAMSAMSVTGTGITANSSLVTTAVTPTVNFTPAGAIVATDVVNVTLRGMISSAAIASADVTVSGGCSGTVAITTVLITTSNPVLDITGITCTAATPASVIVAASRLTSLTAANNYAISVVSPADAGSFFYYVGDENDVLVTATVDDVLSFFIRNTADTADQVNVASGPVGPNLCDLGNLSTAGVQTCSYRLKVTTNASAGYTVNIATDGSLRKGTDFINNVTEDTLVTSGTEGYGIEFNGGAATTGTVTESGDFNDDDTPTATALVAGINTSLYSVDGPNNPGATDVTNTALVTHRAESDAGTAAGSYQQLVTYTVTASF